MSQKRHKPEEIVAKLRQVDVLLSQARSVGDTPDFEYVLTDSTVSKVHANATGAKGG